MGDGVEKSMRPRQRDGRVRARPPILLLLVIGVMDVGKAFRYRLDETHLANQGARWVAVNRSLSPNLGDYLRDQTVNDELHDKSCVTLSYIDMNGNGLKKDVGDAVKVEMKIRFAGHR